MKARRVLFGSMVALAGLAVCGWFARAELSARYHLYRFRRAADPAWESDLPHLTQIGARLKPELLTWLDEGDESMRARASAVLSGWARESGSVCQLVRDLNQRFAHMNEVGRAAALSLATQLAAELSDEEKTVCRALAAQGCEQVSAPVRERAACLAMKCDPALVPSVVKLLSAPEPEVRRAALLAVGTCRDLVGDEEMLRWLHDPDSDVRRVCTTALRGRGLREQDVVMGGLLTSSRAADRLRLVEMLAADGEIDRAAWLRRLAVDPVPAVRAAVARAAVERSIPGLSDQLARLARTDPDATVRANALHFWSRTGGVRPASAP